MIKIIGSLTSPFTRMVRVVCQELELAHEFEVTAPFGKLDAAQDVFIRSYNPLMKVPVLVHDDITIMDSRVIVRHLVGASSKELDFKAALPDSLAEENILTVIYGVTEAGILSFMLKVANPEISPEIGYVARSADRIKHGLMWLDNQSQLGRRFGFSEVALICGLEWMRKRNVYDWAQLPHISKTYNAFCDRPSFVKTRIPDTM